jgi:hypothetical protein
MRAAGKHAAQQFVYGIRPVVGRVNRGHRIAQIMERSLYLADQRQ